MNVLQKIAFTVLAGALISAPLAREGNAQKAPVPVYTVEEADVRDPALFKTYTERQETLIESFGGSVLARWGKVTPIAGSAPLMRISIYTFPNRDMLDAWRRAPEQAELTTMRDKSSDFRAFVVEGTRDTFEAKKSGLSPKSRKKGPEAN